MNLKLTNDLTCLDIRDKVYNEMLEDIWLSVFKQVEREIEGRLIEQLIHQVEETIHPHH